MAAVPVPFDMVQARSYICGMRPTLIGLVCLLMLLSSCGNPVPTPPEKVPVPPASMFMEREYHFSNEQMRDKFLIGYYGPDVLDTTVHLIILSLQGDTLYHTQWDGTNLLDSSTLSATDSVKHVVANAAMQSIIDGKSSKATDSLYDPPLSKHAFTYQVGKQAFALEWSSEKKAVVLR